MSAAPKYATPRDPRRRSDGAAIARIAEAMGVPLLPWQRQVLDVATERTAPTERNPDGELVHPFVFVTVPRQSGKSTLVWTLVMHRLLTLEPMSTMFYTAQTQQDARRRFRDLEKLTLASPFASRIKFRRSMSDTGAEGPARAPRAGGEKLPGPRISTFAPGPNAVHGETPELVILDEVFAHSLETGTAMVDDAIIPAQQTLEGRKQLWLISTAGTSSSGFMRRWVEAGRAGTMKGLAYFEWSAPAGADLYDPAVIESFHPAVGHLVTAQGLLDSRPASPAAWQRAFCNLWVETADPLVDLGHWDALPSTWALDAPRRADVAIGFELEIDGASSSVVAAWRTPAGDPCIHVLHTAPGSAWVRDYVTQLQRSWRPRAIGGDNAGPTRRLLDELDVDGVTIERLTLGDFTTATDSLLTAAGDGTLHHDGSATLRRGIAGAVLQRTGDASRISRQHSSGHVAGLIAAVVALRLYDHADRPLAKPLVTF